MRRLLVAALLAAGCGSKAEPTKQAAAPAVNNKARPVVFVAPDGPPPDANKDEKDGDPSKTAPVSALTGKIRLPADGGKWPEAFPPAPPPVESKAVHLALEYGFHPMVVSPESGRFVIAQKLGRRVEKGVNGGTRFVLGDVAAGKVLGEWEVGGEFDPLDLSPDGTRFVAKSAFWEAAKITVFTVGADGRLTRRTVDAHDVIVLNPAEAAGKEKDLVVRWAGFVGNDRVASAAVGGQVRVFRADSLARVGTLDGTPGLTPCVTPDRKQLVAHTAGKAELIDPAQCQAVATRPWPLPSGLANLAASPDGTTLAFAKLGRVRFLAVKTGEYWDQMIPGFGDDAMRPRNFSWCGPGALVHTRKVYDPAASYPVWHLTHQSHADAYSSRQVWAAARMPGEEAKSGPPIRVAVRAFDALPPDFAGIVGAAKTRPGIYVLPAGARVRVDASRLPADRQATSKADFEQRLREVGYVPNATSETVFTLSLDPLSVKSTTYKTVPSMQYNHQPLRVQLRHEGKVLREYTLTKNPPVKLEMAGNEPLAKKAAAEGWGRPDYAGLKTLSVQPHFPGPAFPGQGFGFTQLSENGPLYRPHR